MPLVRLLLGKAVAWYCGTAAHENISCADRLVVESDQEKQRAPQHMLLSEGGLPQSRAILDLETCVESPGKGEGKMESLKSCNLVKNRI